MGKSRKYILNICNSISCGLGTCTTTDQTYNLLNSFVNEGITYPVLTEEELSVLSKLEYELKKIELRKESLKTTEEKRRDVDLEIDKLKRQIDAVS